MFLRILSACHATSLSPTHNQMHEPRKGKAEKEEGEEEKKRKEEEEEKEEDHQEQ